MLPPKSQAVVDRAALLTREEIVRLGIAERQVGDAALAAWDLLRDRMSTGEVRDLRFEARNEAWQAVATALVELGLEPMPNDGYWRVALGVGAGAQRAARYAACALVAPDLLDEEVVDVLLRPWRSVIAD